MPDVDAMITEVEPAVVERVAEARGHRAAASSRRVWTHAAWASRR